jgi:Zn-dependent protease with chaperone function
MLTADFKKALGGIVFKALLALFLLPGLTWGFAHWLTRDADSQIRAGVVAQIAADKSMSAAEKQTSTAFFGALQASATCFSTAPEVAEFRDNVCEPYGTLWQFVVTERVARYTVLGNALLLLLMLGLGALAFANRALQYGSFVFGWRLLTVSGAAQLVLQGAFAVWLSFWLTAHFMHIYIPKLIVLVALLVAAAVFTALVAMFRRAARNNSVQGELISAEQAPQLWTRLRSFAARARTAPPAQLVGGIDANFFVTETPLRVAGKELRGRTLYVSLPLLRQLEADEANAVLAHELGHFSGGDTANSAALGPKLAQYDFYTAQLYNGGAARIAFYLLNLYRVIFEIALQKSSREREFAADSLAASLTSPQAVVRALVKVAAYARYRSEVENQLFNQQQRHDGALDIGQRVASGLAAFSSSPEFNEAMHAGSVPHPFDSHPPLQQRMHNVGFYLPQEEFAAVVCQPAAAPWTRDIPDADAMEQRQWQAFERQFSQAHEEALAYRYEPRNDEERALVERYFPPVPFALKKGGTIVISHAGLHLPDKPEILGWDYVKSVKYDDASLGADRLTIEHSERWLGSGSSKIPLPFAGKDRDRFKQVFGRYWHRHQVMRAQQGS